MMSLLCFLLAGCKEAEEAPEEDPTDDPKTETSWSVPEYTVADLRHYSKPKMIDHALGYYSPLMGDTKYFALKTLLEYTSKDGFRYMEAVINYESIDHTGAPVLLSGILCYPVSMTSDLPLNQLVIHSHATITEYDASPSVAGDIVSLLTLMGPTAVVTADYQGYGVSRDMLHPYLNEELTARHEIDLLKAALDYLESDDSNVSISDDIKAYSVGYSQGGAAALSVHRMLERDEPALAEAIGFSGSVCGDGPYSLTNTFSAYIDQGFLTVPVVLPMMVRSMMASYPELFDGLALEDFFTDEFLATGGGLISLLDAKDRNMIAFNTMLGAEDPFGTKFPLEQILKQEALQPDSPQMRAIVAASERNNCIMGWTPSAPVAFFHSEHDTVVPYANLADLSAWPSKIYSIQYPSNQDADHLECAMLYYTELISKGPAKMQ